MTPELLWKLTDDGLAQSAESTITNNCSEVNN